MPERYCLEISLRGKGLEMNRFTKTETAMATPMGDGLEVGRAIGKAAWGSGERGKLVR
jgi:hypothetical protein